MERVEPAGHAHAVADADVRREALLERLELRPQHVAAAGDHAGHRVVDLRRELGVGRRQIEERDPGEGLRRHTVALASRANSS